MGSPLALYSVVGMQRMLEALVYAILVVPLAAGKSSRFTSMLEALAYAILVVPAGRRKELPFSLLSPLV